MGFRARGPGSTEGQPNARAIVTAGISVATAVQWVFRTITTGVSVAIAGITAVVKQTAGVAVSTFTTGTAAKPSVTAGVAVSNASGGTAAKPVQTLGAEIKQITYNLTRTVGSDGASSIGTHSWPNPTNAQGLHDGLNASAPGDVTSRDYTLELTYPNHLAKSDLAITSAAVNLYGLVGGDPLSTLTTTTISYDIGAGYVVLATINGNYSNLTTPRNYTVPITTWTHHDALKLKIRFQVAAAGGSAFNNVDAFELVLTATKTDTL